MRTCDHLIPGSDETDPHGPERAVWNTQLERMAAAKIPLANPVSISNRVSEAIHRWIRDGGRTPTKLYLGDHEHEAMRRLIDEHRQGFPFGSGALGGGLVFMGLRVHRVLEPEHLQVC